MAALHLRIAKRRAHPDQPGWKKRGLGGPGAANRTLALIGAMFGKAAALGFTGPNPARGVKKFPSHSRERFLHADELPRFFKAVSEEPNGTMRDFVWLALFTGARRANVQAMRWDQLNLERGTWRIPQTKSGDPQTVHLPAPALEILKRRQAESESDEADSKNPWVFPGRGRSGHLEEPKGAWNRICERAGLGVGLKGGVVIHDLRRTLGSWQAATGANLPVIGKSLGHKQQNTTAIYARLDLDPVRQAVDKATAAMLAAAEAKEQSA